jgi:hypothetical protein
MIVDEVQIQTSTPQHLGPHALRRRLAEQSIAVNDKIVKLRVSVDIIGLDAGANGCPTASNRVQGQSTHHLNRYHVSERHYKTLKGKSYFYLIGANPSVNSSAYDTQRQVVPRVCGHSVRASRKL